MGRGPAPRGEASSAPGRLRVPNFGVWPHLPLAVVPHSPLRDPRPHSFRLSLALATDLYNGTFALVSMITCHALRPTLVTANLRACLTRSDWISKPHTTTYITPANYSLSWLQLVQQHAYKAAATAAPSFGAAFPGEEKHWQHSNLIIFCPENLAACLPTTTAPCGGLILSVVS